MLRRPLNNRDLHNFNTDRMTLVMAFLWFEVKQDHRIFDYDPSFYKKVDGKLDFALLTTPNGDELISICYPKGELRLSKGDVAFMERKRSLNMYVRQDESEILDFL